MSIMCTMSSGQTKKVQDSEDVCGVIRRSVISYRRSRWRRRRRRRSSR